MTLIFIKRLRDEMRFKSIDALRLQIEKDKEAANNILAEKIKSNR